MKSWIFPVVAIVVLLALGALAIVIGA